MRGEQKGLYFVHLDISFLQRYIIIIGIEKTLTKRVAEHFAINYQFRLVGVFHELHPRREIFRTYLYSTRILRATCMANV